jgi:hypothetical protein
MNEYMMIFRHELNNGAEAPSPEQMKMVMAQWQAWIKGIAARGRYSGTNRLLNEGKTIKPGNIISDGPYAEVKEIIGGYLIVRAASLDEAMEMAKSCPNMIYGGNVEVRAVMSIDPDPGSNNFLNNN